MAELTFTRPWALVFMPIVTYQEAKWYTHQHWLNLTKCSAADADAKLLQSCPTLWDPIDCSPQGSPVPGILQERTLKWVAISFSNAWKWSRSCPTLSDPMDWVYQAPPSMGFSRQEYWSGVPLPSLDQMF